MRREKIFSKLNMIDYKNKLEKILEKKFFSEDVKNLLLNMIYKVESSFSDYIKIKALSINKQEFFEEILEIIELDCEKIEVIKLKSNEENTNETIENKKQKVIKKENRIITYSNEKYLLDAIYEMKKINLNIKEQYKIIKNSLEFFLVKGNKINKSEIIRDFDGWSWNIVSEEIENININLIYQNLQILLGDDFIENWIKNYENKDYIKLMKIKLINKYGNEKVEKLTEIIFKLCIMIYIKDNKNEIEKLKKQKEEINEYLIELGNKEEYFNKLLIAKKTINLKIKKINDIMVNNLLLKKEFKKRNEKLEKKLKIFSLSDLHEILLKEKEEQINQIYNCEKLINPKNYDNIKTELEYKLDLINSINKTKKDFQKLLLEFEKTFISIFKDKIIIAETKKEMIQLIYQFRYYIYLPINDVKKIFEEKDLKKEIVSLNKLLIEKACKLKVIINISNLPEKNYEIVSQILNTKIINLQDINIEILKKGEKRTLNIYEENNIDKKIEDIKLEEILIKYNKKLKLFI